MTTSVDVSPTGKQFAIANFDTRVTAWDVESGRKLWQLPKQGTGMSDVAYSPDGRWVATAGWDGTVKIWDAASGSEITGLYGHTAKATSVDFSPDGRQLVTASTDGTVRVFLTRIDDLIALARSRLTRDLTTQECRQYLHLPDGCPVSSP
jgi:WD40 repeat protein